jgi:low temperature requirement protein LtrA
MHGAGEATDHTASEPESRVSTLELFFDLVFVFAFTQITGSVTHDHTAGGLARGVLLFAVLWWAWGAYAWLTNAVRTHETWPRLVVLSSMAAMLVTALAVPTAWDDGGVAFALGYLVVMLLHTALFALAGENPETTRRAILRLAPTNLIAALVLVVAGLTDGTAQAVLWLVAVAVCYAGPYVTGVAGFTVQPGHFVERHGLIVIIALGETLIVAAAGLAGAARTPAATATGVLAVATTCGLWWSYFQEARTTFEHALAAREGSARSCVARDVFSIMHFPMLCGVIAMAAATEEALAHPHEALALSVRVALSAGVVLFVCGTAAALWRATGRAPVWRIVLGLVAAVGVIAAGVVPWVAMALLLAMLVAISVVEYGRPSRVGAL